jgi:hypothetical protein
MKYRAKPQAAGHFYPFHNYMDGKDIGCRAF